jgi:hypothetical protein
MNEKIFDNDEDFLKYIEFARFSPDPLFCAIDINRLYVLAGEKPPFESFPRQPFITLPVGQPDTEELLRKAHYNVENGSRLSKKVRDACEDSGDSGRVVMLDDYR